MTKSIMEHIMWNIADDLDGVKYSEPDDNDEYGLAIVEMNERWNATAIPVQYPQHQMEEFAHILVDVGRFDSFKRVLRLRLPCTVRDVLEGIRDIYQAPVTEVEVKEHEDDLFGYRKTALERLSRGEVVRAFELNGYRAHFEGLRQAYGCRDAIFEVRLGT